MPDRFLRFSIAAILIFAAHSTGFGQGMAPRAQAVDPSMATAAPMMPVERPSTLIDPSRKLQQGDLLSFKIEQDRDPLVTVGVSRTGDVYIDPVGGVRVAGLTVSQAAGEIKRLLEKDYYYSATVRLDLLQINATATMGYVYLSGEIERVGGVPIFAERPMKLSEVILNAGGFKRYADDRKVKVTRGKDTFIVDVKKILKDGRSDLDVVLQEGDRVFVPETFMKK